MRIELSVVINVSLDSDTGIHVNNFNIDVEIKNNIVLNPFEIDISVGANTTGIFENNICEVSSPQADCPQAKLPDFDIDHF